MTEQLFNRSVGLNLTQRDGNEDSSENLVLEFPFSSEEPYARSSFFRDDPWIEVLGHRNEEVDLSRLNTGAPVLLNHGAGRTADVPYNSIGITKRAWIDNGRGYVEVKLSRRDGMRSVLQDVKDGIISNVSVGYQIQERALTKRNSEQPDEYRVTSWLPMEITLCDIPADATVGIGRSITNEVEMENKEMVTEEVKEETRSVEIDLDKIKNEAMASERKRSSEIKQLVRSVSLDEKIAEDMIERGVTVDQAKDVVLSKLQERTSLNIQNATSADIYTSRDETETKREGMTDAVLYRADPRTKLSDNAKQYAGLSLIELARDHLASKGVSVRGLDRMQIAARAFEGTSDLTSVFANVANKSLRQAYELAPRTFTAWARETRASDFRTITRVALSDAPMLKKVTENGEFERGAVTDGKETYQLATYGKIVGFTRQSMINDDLSALTRVPSAMAAAVAALESDVVYGILTTNAALSDSVALFHSTHGNLTGTGTAIDVTSLGTARALMRKQKTPQGVVMNIRPRFLIVPGAKETLAEQFVSDNYVASESSKINTISTTLTVVAEARLDDNSTTAWYLAADPSMIDTIEYCYLEGQQGAYLETRQGFEIDGMEIKVRSDFAAKAIDYRGIYKNVGA